MHIVALNGSPHRKGNTATLMQWVLDGCAEAGAGVEWLHVADCHIEYCQGCFTCLRTGACPIVDDVPLALIKLRDGVALFWQSYNCMLSSLRWTSFVEQR